MYTLTEGAFFAEELTLVKGEVFKVEKIGRYGTHQGVPSALVKWEGFPGKYNSWVPRADLVRRRGAAAATS